MQRVLSAGFLIPGLLFAALASAAFAEHREAPVAIVGATIHEAGLPTVPAGTIVIVEGRIAAAGANVEIPAHAARLEAAGLHAYPGFIDAYTNLGVPDSQRSEAERARFEDENQDTSQGPLAETSRANRRGILPQWRADEVYAPTSDDLTAHRKSGFTTALIGPRGGLLAGRSAVVELSDLPRRRAVLLTDFAQHASFSPYEPGSYPATPLGGIAALRQFFYDVQWYRELARRPREIFPDARVPVDSALQAGVDVSIGAQVLIFEAQSEQEILRALKLAEEFDLRIWISGGREAHKLKELLKSRSIPVIASLGFEDEPEAEIREAGAVREYWEPKRLRDERLRLWHEQVDNVQVLAAAGVDVALGTRGAEDLAAFRKNLRAAIEHGLDAKTALAALTDTPAKLVGMQNALGTLTPGALGNVVLFDKPFEEKKAKARYMFIEGQRYEFEDEERDRDKKKGDDEEEEKEEDETEAEVEDAGSPGVATAVDDPLREDTAEVARGSAADVGTTALAEPPSRSEQAPDEHGPDHVGTSGLDVSTPGLASVGADTADSDTNGAGGAKTGPKPEPSEPTWRVEIEADRKPTLHTGGDVFIRGATVLPVSGPTLQDASIHVRGGRIEAFGSDLTPPDGVTVIEGAGLYVMPGIIDCHSHMALDAVNEGTLSISAEVRVGDVINHRQEAIYRALAGGVTTIHTMHGSANTIGGECIVLKLRYGKQPDELRFAGAPRSIKFALGENVTHMNSAPRGTRFPHTRMGVESVLRQALTAAEQYRARQTSRAEGAPPLRRDLRLEALAGVLTGDVWVHCHGYRADEYLRLIDIAETFGFRIGVMQHCLEGYRIMPEIALHGSGVSTFANDWAYKLESYSGIPYNAAMLTGKGISASVNSDSANTIRYMNMQAAMSVRWGGLSSQDALALITRNPAEQLGIAERVGTVEVGKDADLAIFDGHPLDSFSRCVYTLIDGEVYFANPVAQRVTPHTPVQRAEQAPAPLAVNTTGIYLLTGATIHPVSADPIENGALLIRAGEIAEVGANISSTGATVVDLKGMHIWPGMIDAGSELGLSEILEVPATRDEREMARIQPELRAISAIHPHSAHIAIARASGVTTALARPAGGMISGTSAVIDLAGWTTPEMLRNPDFALHMDVPSLPLNLTGKRGKERRKQHDEQMRELEEFLRRAESYARWRSAGGDLQPPRDLRLEALAPYLAGEKPVVFTADTHKKILDTLEFADKHKLRPIIYGGREAWKCAAVLADKKVPVILSSVWTYPRGEFEPFDSVFGCAAELDRAGVRYCFATDTAATVSDLPYQAGTAVAYGLAPERAMYALTLGAAEILGVAEDVGSIEVGKDANLIVSSDIPIQAISGVTQVFIRGEPMDMSNLQSRNRDQFANRPTPVLPPTRELVGPPSLTRTPQTSP